MLLVFRLNKATGTQATFTVGKEIIMDKMIFKGWSADFPSNAENDAAGNVPTAGPKAIYLHMDCFDDNNIVFYQGRNNTISGTAIGNMIPLGAIKEEKFDYKQMDLTVINFPEIWEATKTITITLNQIEVNTVSQLTNGQAFGVDADTDGGGPNAIDHGINLFFEVERNPTQHNITQTFNIADAA